MGERIFDNLLVAPEELQGGVCVCMCVCVMDKKRVLTLVPLLFCLVIPLILTFQTAVISNEIKEHVIYRDTGIHLEIRQPNSQIIGWNLVPNLCNFSKRNYYQHMQVITAGGSISMDLD